MRLPFMDYKVIPIPNWLVGEVRPPTPVPKGEGPGAPTPAEDIPLANRLEGESAVTSPVPKSEGPGAPTFFIEG